MPMRFPTRRPPVYRPAKTFDDIGPLIAYMAFVGFVVAFAGIMIGTSVRY